MKYVVTGISRLTGERVVISRPKEYLVALGMLERARARYGRCVRRSPAYRNLRLDEAAEEGSLF